MTLAFIMTKQSVVCDLTLIHLSESPFSIQRIVLFRTIVITMKRGRKIFKALNYGDMELG